MCFRPSTADQSAQCPECGKKVNAVMGVIPNVCPFCESDMGAAAASINAGSIPQPGAPGFPAAPSAPAAPGAPKAPSF